MYKFIGKFNQYYEIKFNTNCPDTEKVGKGLGSCGGSNNTKDISKYNGLNKIQLAIKNSGGVNNFINDISIPVLEPTAIESSDIFGMNTDLKQYYNINDMSNLKTIKNIGNIKLKLFNNNESNNNIAITSGNILLGSIDGFKGGVNAILTDELRGLGGIGKAALMEYFNLNPDKIIHPGGMTSVGKNSYMKVLELINSGKKEVSFSDDEINEINNKISMISKKLNTDPITVEEVILSRNNIITNVVGLHDPTIKEIKPGTVWSDPRGKKIYIKGIDDKYAYLRHDNGRNQMVKNSSLATKFYFWRMKPIKGAK